MGSASWAENKPSYKRGLTLMAAVWAATVVVIGLIGFSPTEIPSRWQRIVTAAILFSLTGTVAAALVSFVHTALMRRSLSLRRLSSSTLLGAALGATLAGLIAIGGLSIEAILPAISFGAAGGAAYGALVAARARQSSNGAPAV